MTESVATCKKGIPLVISGPSGCGKGTIVKELLKKYPETFALSVSATTRAPREGEVNGREYYFITKEEFERRIADNEILEYTTYVENYYGTPKKELYERTERGINVILEIETEGGMNIRSLCEDAVLVFVYPPSMEKLEKRLRDRGTNTDEDILNRLARAREEIHISEQYDYIIVNEDGKVEEAAEAIAEILRCENRRAEKNRGITEQFLAIK